MNSERPLHTDPLKGILAAISGPDAQVPRRRPLVFR